MRGARIKWATKKPGNEAIAVTILRMAVKAAVEDFWPTRFDGMSELAKFTAAQTMARKRGFVVREADNANDLKRCTLVRHGEERHFATIDEVLATLERVKP